MRILLLALAIVAVLGSNSGAQVFSVSTVAGAPGQSGSNDGTGAAARFQNPGALAVDASGNLFVADVGGGRLRRITPAAVVTTVGTIPTSTSGLAVSADGTVFLADASSHVVRRMEADGSLSVFAGQPGIAGYANDRGEAARFNQPNGLAFDDSGRLYVADTGNHSIRRIGADGAVTTLAGLPGVSGSVDGIGFVARFSSPTALVVAPDGVVTIADRGNYVLRRLSPDGMVTTFAGNGSSYSGAPEGPGTAVRFGGLGALARDSTGHFFVPDASLYTIRRVTPDAFVTTIAGLGNYSGFADGVGSVARFSSPAGVVIDAAGRIFVADPANRVIRLIEAIVPPAISVAPSTQTVAVGTSATFGVVASGGAPVFYRWQRKVSGMSLFENLPDGGPYSGALTATLAISAATVAMHGDQFRCVVSNEAGSVTSAPAALSVLSAPSLPSTRTAVFYVGTAGTLHLGGGGVPAPVYTVSAGVLPPWLSLDSNSGVLSGTPPAVTGAPFVFAVSATNTRGSAVQEISLRADAALTLPTVTLLSPRRSLVAPGGTLTLVASAGGSAPLAYQWKRNGRPIAGATASSYTISGAARGDAGYYQLIAANPAGAVVGAAAFVHLAYTSTELIGWGSSVAPPTGLNAVAVAAGASTAMALRSDGGVSVWGDSTLAAVPASATDVVAIAAGDYHCLALRADGTVVAWGNNNLGQATVPAGLAGVVAIAAGYQHSVALKADGTVIEWGQVSASSGYVPAPAGLVGISGIAAGGTATHAVRADGSVVTWGSGSYSISSVPGNVVPAVSVFTNGVNSFSIRADGSLAGWGSTSYSLPSIPAGLGTVVDVAAYSGTAMALKSDGTVGAWGLADVPAAVLSAVSIIDVAAGSGFRVALRNSSSDGAPVLVSGPASVAANPGQIVVLRGVFSAGTAGITYQWYRAGAAITGATTATLRIDGVTAANVGAYTVTASNALGAASSGQAVVSLNSAPLLGPDAAGRVALSIGQSLVLGLSAAVPAGASVRWERNGRAIPGATGRTHTITAAQLADAGYYRVVYDAGSGSQATAAFFVLVAPSATQTLRIGSAGRSLSAPADFGVNIVSLAARGSLLLGLRSDGTVVRNVVSDYYYSSPGTAATAVAALREIVSVALGSDYGYALRADGTVAGWAEQSYGVESARTDELSGIVAISAGSTHLLALRADGTVASVGASQFGATAVPAGLRDVVAVAAGDHFSLALKADGTVVGWGNNGSGVSTPPPGLAGVVAIAAGSSASYALKADGSVVAWGYSGYGQTTVPAGLREVAAITAGDSAALAVRQDGSMTVWGTVNSSTTPFSVPTSASQVIHGDLTSSEVWLLRDATGDATPTITTQPVDVAALRGQDVRFAVSAVAGTAPLAYQWRRSGAAITGATESTLLVSGVTPADAGSFEVLVSNYRGSVTSRAAALSVDPTPAVTVSPAGRHVVAVGGSLTLSGASPLPGALSFQWRRDGRALPGATQLSHTISGATVAHTGRYELVVSNSAGVAVSASIWVVVPQPLELVTWGQTTSLRLAGPSDLGPVSAVAAGGSHVLALRVDGTVAAWGGNEAFQCSVPSGLGQVVAIAAGLSFSLALRADGTVVSWGSLNYVPSGTSGVVALAADVFSSHAIALRGDGTVIQWSTDGVRTDLPPAARDLVAVAAGPYGAAVALRSDGRVVQWGRPQPYGTTYAPMPEGIGQLVSVANTDSYSYGLLLDGTVVRWTPSAAPAVTPTVVPELFGIDSLVGSLAAVGGIKPGGNVLLRSGAASESSALFTGASALAPAHRLALGGAYNGYFGVALRDPSGDRGPGIVSISPAQTVAAGQSLKLTVVVTGTPAPAIQWYRNGVALAGATGESYSVSSPATGASGDYSVVVSNPLGSVTSAAITVTVLPSAGARGLLVGTSRSTSGGSLMGTFVVEGTANKQLLVRGLGPALSAYGGQGAMSDPRISIHDAAGTLVTSNDNWSQAANSATAASVAASVGALALPAGSRDAAVLRTFSPGAYQVRLAPASGADGLALLEVYDADTNPRLVALSVFGRADPGPGVLVQGLALGAPPTGRTYLVRALGPGLGSSGALADPVLTIRDLADNVVASNDDWAGAAALVTLAERVGAQPLADVASRDAALSFTPAAAGGTYTVQVGPAAGTPGGVVLLEVFEADASRASVLAPAVLAPPQPAVALAGASARFGVVASGRPTPTFQWRKNGTPIVGATRVVLELAAVSSGDAAEYSVAVTNSAGTVVSPVAALVVSQVAATHAIIGPGYHAGAAVSLACTFSYAGAAASLGWELELPPGWSYAGGTGAEGDVKPAVGATGKLSWAWSAPPAAPFSFTLRFNVPAAENQPRTLAATALLRTDSALVTAGVGPASFVLSPAPTVHTADTNADSRLSLAELTRVIELYNVRFGTVRSGAYTTAAAATEDGFTLDSARGDIAAALSRYHHADTDRDGRLNLSELLRVIQLYNHRSAAVRTGQYHVAPGTEDGFDPGP